MFFFQADPKSSKHGGQIVVDVLKKQGVKQIFTLSGGHISPILVAAEESGVRVVDTRHEVFRPFY